MVPDHLMRCCLKMINHVEIHLNKCHKGCSTIFNVCIMSNSESLAINFRAGN